MSAAKPTAVMTGPIPVVGDLLAGRYRLDALIGNGGMSSVYRATDTALGRTVAIKLFRRDVADAADVRRQDSEMRVVASLSHPGVVTLYDAVADDDRVFLVLQHIDGDDLRSRLGSGPMDPAAVRSIATDIADALAYVHARGVLHRDLKPANILVCDVDGRTSATLTDFGIAQLVDGSRLTEDNSVLGTAAYLSPEQALGSALTPATDVYSFGLVLLECLTGRRAFQGSGLEAAAARLSADPLIPHELGQGWRTLLADMTAREPESRPTAAEVAARMRELPHEELDPTLRLDTEEIGTVAMGAVDAATERTAAPTAPTVPAAAAPEAASPAATYVTPTTNPIEIAAETTARIDRRLARSGGLYVAIAAVVALVLGAWGLNSAIGTDEPGLEYPAVEGDLGAALVSLQDAVAPVDGTVGDDLRAGTLAVTEASAAADWTTALAALDGTTATLDAAIAADGISASAASAITAAIAAVRGQLDALSAPPAEPVQETVVENTGPGEGGPGKGPKEDGPKDGPKDDGPKDGGPGGKKGDGPGGKGPGH